MANIARTVETEALAGLVERVTFHNPDNGFCVLRIKARGQRELITVVGHAATVTAGEFVQLSGAWVNDRTHGQQFKAGGQQWSGVGRASVRLSCDHMTTRDLRRC